MTAGSKSYTVQSQSAKREKRKQLLWFPFTLNFLLFPLWLSLLLCFPRWTLLLLYGKVFQSGLWVIRRGATTGTVPDHAGATPPSGLMTTPWYLQEQLFTTGTKSWMTSSWPEKALHLFLFTESFSFTQNMLLGIQPDKKIACNKIHTCLLINYLHVFLYFLFKPRVSQVIDSAKTRLWVVISQMSAVCWLCRQMLPIVHSKTHSVIITVGSLGCNCSAIGSKPNL